jgi:hypothetical protein
MNVPPLLLVPGYYPVVVLVYTQVGTLHTTLLQYTRVRKKLPFFIYMYTCTPPTVDTVQFNCTSYIVLGNHMNVYVPRVP